MARAWTEEEEQIIRQEVEKNPNNLREAFFIASLKTDRTASSVCTRYYGAMNEEKEAKDVQIKNLKAEIIKLYDLNMELKKQLDERKTGLAD
jgi:hypothetical protein